MSDTVPIEYLQVSRDIPYVANPDGQYQLFDLYVPHSEVSRHPPPPLLFFVHGGAWRAEDKSMHKTLAQRLARLTSWPVAVPNYRLTTPESKLQHPAHAEDLLAFLNFILDWAGPGHPEAPRLYDSSRIYAIGHSCSAHMLTSIILERTDVHAPAPTLAPSSRLLLSLRGIIMSEGIYNIDMLLQSFPGYKEWFIANTFGDHTSYAPWSTMSMDVGKDLGHVKWLILHSQGDTLVDMLQSEEMAGGLKDQGSVVVYNTELTGEHNAILADAEYHTIVSNFVLSCEK